MCFAKNLQSIQLACNLKILRKKIPTIIQTSGSLQMFWSLLLVIHQAQEHPRINQDWCTQSEVSFHMVCMLVAGFSLCLFKGFREPGIFAGYLKRLAKGGSWKQKHFVSLSRASRGLWLWNWKAVCHSMGPGYFFTSVYLLNTHHKGNHRALNMSNHRSSETVPDI